MRLTRIIQVGSVQLQVFYKRKAEGYVIPTEEEQQSNNTPLLWKKEEGTTSQGIKAAPRR